MREILFRGKRLDKGEWVDGCLYYFHYESNPEESVRAFIFLIDDEICNENEFEVDFETVSQYTGKDDRNGKHIFDGDVVKEIEHGITFLIEWSDESLCYFIKTLKGGRDYLCDIWDCEVIGNRWDNPELLEV